VHPDLTSAAGIREGDVLAGKYRGERVLGMGGMGVVVAAHHLQLDERVALKFLLPEGLENPGGGGAGGAIVVEAPAVSIGPYGGLLAGGGGGGSGGIALNAGFVGLSPSFQLVRSPTHLIEQVPAIVGTGCSATYALSGPGTGANLGVTAGTAGDAPVCAGGGGAGWIRINTGGASPVIDANAVFSPDIGSGALTWGGLTSPP
jgi:hypothetical protein